MKLLFITQKADLQDDVLGFVHRWIEKLAEQYSHLTVICLEKGKCSLPENVHVLSLGKEGRQSRLVYLLRFYQYIWSMRKGYDAVFVHMNPIYVVTGFIFWRLLRKQIFLWYNHERGNWIAKAAVRRVQKVFYTSPFSFAAQFRNSQQMPAGIDTNLFCPDVEQQKERNSLLYVGRLSRIKNVDVLIEALNRLNHKGLEFVLHIVGAPGNNDVDYYSALRKQAAEMEEAGKIYFNGKMPNHQIPQFYQKSQILFNLSPPGLFDKTILEAMACGCLVLVSSPAFKHAIPGTCMFNETDPEDLAKKIEDLLKLPDKLQQEYGERFREYVVQNHGLEMLVGRLEEEISS